MTIEHTRCVADSREPDDVCAEAGSVEQFPVENLVLCHGDRDVFEIELEAGSPVTICAVPVEGDPSDLTITILRECNFIRSRAGCLQYTSRLDGVHQVQVSERTRRVRRYRLEVEGL